MFTICTITNFSSYFSLMVPKDRDVTVLRQVSFVHTE